MVEIDSTSIYIPFNCLCGEGNEGARLMELRQAEEAGPAAAAAASATTAVGQRAQNTSIHAGRAAMVVH